MFPIDYFLSFQLQLARNGLLSGGNFATIQYRYKTVSIKITVIIQRYNQFFYNISCTSCDFNSVAMK